MTGRSARQRLTSDETGEISRLGTNLRDARVAAKLSQRALGRLTDTSPTYISHVESGMIVGISVLKVVTLAKPLGVSASQLLGELPPEILALTAEEDSRKETNRRKRTEWLERRAAKEAGIESSAPPARGRPSKKADHSPTLAPKAKAKPRRKKPSTK